MKALSLTFFFGSFILNLAALSSATDYCDPDLCGYDTHIACNNNGALSWDCSSDAQLMPINNALKEAIVNKHNELRNKVAQGGFAGFKAAARMATMKWNSELAKIASYNVKQCEMEHDECRNTAKFRYAGQNLAYAVWSGYTFPLQQIAIDQIVSWFDEYKDTPKYAIDNFRSPRDGSVIGHFTQIIQEKSTDVGCAILKQTKYGMTEQYMACNYAYTNFIDRPVYRTSSRAAGKCNTGVNPKYRFLCSSQEKYAMNTVY